MRRSHFFVLAVLVLVTAACTGVTAPEPVESGVPTMSGG